MQSKQFIFDIPILSLLKRIISGACVTISALRFVRLRWRNKSIKMESRDVKSEKLVFRREKYPKRKNGYWRSKSVHQVRCLLYLHHVYIMISSCYLMYLLENGTDIHPAYCWFCLPITSSSIRTGSDVVAGGVRISSALGLSFRYSRTDTTDGYADK